MECGNTPPPPKTSITIHKSTHFTVIDGLYFQHTFYAITTYCFRINFSNAPEYKGIGVDIMTWYCWYKCHQVTAV